MGIDAATSNVALEPCTDNTKSPKWILGYSGVLFVPDKGAGADGENCVTTPQARALAAEAEAEAAVYEGYDDNSMVGDASHGEGGEDALLGWKPNWKSGYPAVRDLKAASDDSPQPPCFSLTRRTLMECTHPASTPSRFGSKLPHLC